VLILVSVGELVFWKAVLSFVEECAGEEKLHLAVEVSHALYTKLQAL